MPPPRRPPPKPPKPAAPTRPAPERTGRIVPISLRSTIEMLVQAFADDVLQAIGGASLEDILSEAAQPSGGTATAQRSKRGARRPTYRGPDVARVIDAIVLALKEAKVGMRLEEIEKALSLDKKTITRPLTMALAAKIIRKTGQRRATRYFARHGQ